MILIAPNAFKESLTASQAAEAIERGLQSVNPQVLCRRIPLADGGDGTLETLLSQVSGTLETAEVHDPLGGTTTGRYGVIDHGRTAVIELAVASGLHLLPPSQRDPLLASTRGTGELVLHALNHGAEKIILALGGSATVDGGTGLLSALGARFLDSSGQELPDGGGSLVRLSAIDLTSIDQRLQTCDWIALADVRTPLCGPHGAARTFGPQKGATPEAVGILDRGLDQLADVLLKTTARDVRHIEGGGAAGGVAASLTTVSNARIVPGARFLMDLMNFSKYLEAASFLITGEGIFDATSLSGKATGEALIMAQQRGIPSALICGTCALPRREIPAATVEELTVHASSRNDAMHRGALLVEEAASRLARRIQELRRS